MKIQALSDIEVTALEIMKMIQFMAGGLMAFRRISFNVYKVTLSDEKGKQNILQGLKVDDVNFTGHELSRREVMVSFLRLLAYTTDKEIYTKLQLWGVTPVSPIKQRYWLGTNVADGTRFVRITFEG